MSTRENIRLIARASYNQKIYIIWKRLFTAVCQQPKTLKWLFTVDYQYPKNVKVAIYSQLSIAKKCLSGCYSQLPIVSLTGFFLLFTD